jgi:transcriptional regulator with XRE-family HTH domain
MTTLPVDPSRAAGAAAVPGQTLPDGEGASCGQFLRRARERRGLTLEEIAQRTKLPVRHLAALERDDFAVLPTGMYRRAEVRAYAEAVGLDRTAALAAFDSSSEETASRTGASAHVSVPHRSTRRARVWIAAALGLAAGVIALAVLARQPRAGNVAFVAAPAPAATADVASTTPAGNVAVTADQRVGGDAVLAGTSTRVAGAAQSGTTESGAAPPISDTQAQDNPPDRIAPAAGDVEPQLVVTTDPPGASVTVNGIHWGITPVAIRYLPPGTKRVRVTLDGYRAEEQVIHVGAGRRATTLRIPLQSQAGDVDAARNLIPENEDRGN